MFKICQCLDSQQSTEQILFPRIWFFYIHISTKETFHFLLLITSTNQLQTFCLTTRVQQIISGTHHYATAWSYINQHGILKEEKTDLTGKRFILWPSIFRSICSMEKNTDKIIKLIFIRLLLDIIAGLKFWKS